VLVSAAIALVAIAGGGAVWQLWGPQTGTAAPGTVGLDPARVAVLYLDDESGGELSHLADGLSEALMEELAKVKALRVISPNGVAPFRESRVSLDSIAATLNVGTLVRGNVERTRAGVRVTVRLFDGDDGVEIDRAAFELASTDLLAMRDTVTGRVADFLRQRLGRDIALQEARAGTESVDAWLLVQRAERARKDAEAALDADSADVGHQLFERADSLLALAESADREWPTPIVQRASLAIRRARLAADNRRRSRLVTDGLDHVERALVLDPRNAAAFEHRGTLRLYKVHFGLEPHVARARELGQLAEEDLQQAVTLDASRASAWNTLSYVQYLDHKKVDANLSAQRAYEADAYLASARDIIWRLYTTSYDLEQFAAASKWCDHGRGRFPDDPAFSECKLWMMTTRAEPPDVDAAWRVLHEIEGKMTKPAWDALRPQLRMLVAVPIARAGLADSARRVIEAARASGEDDPSGELIGREVVVRTLIGDKDEALRLLGLYLTSHPEHRKGFATGNTWWWRPLQDDPRFKSLVGADG
jgi:TolB-like protein